MLLFTPCTAGAGSRQRRTLKDISFANVTISGTPFEIFKGVLILVAGRLSLAFFLHMAIMVLITAAVYRLIIIITSAVVH